MPVILKKPSTMSVLSEYLRDNPVIYVTRDIERACGMPIPMDGYYSIANHSILAKTLPHTDKTLFVDHTEPLSTLDLLKRPEVLSFLKQWKHPNILVFKPSTFIEQQCKKQGWHLLNPSAALAQEVEEKISQVDWLGDLTSLLPEFQITKTKDVTWNGEPFILQFNRAHTGVGTELIDTPDELKRLQEQFPERPARCATYVRGPVFTLNVAVVGTAILPGNISYQITGLTPFTDNPFATIGNDWALPHHILTDEQHAAIIDIAQQVGEKMSASGWHGLFGIDCILDRESGHVYLLEINARQPASTTYESELQRTARATGTPGLTMFEAHLAGVLGLAVEEQSIIPIRTGAQIVQRVTRFKKMLDGTLKEKAHAHNMTTLEIEHKQLGKELLIIRSTEGLMASHNVLNPIAATLL